MRAYDAWIRCGAVRAGRGLSVGADGASKAGWGGDGRVAYSSRFLLRLYLFCQALINYLPRPDAARLPDPTLPDPTLPGLREGLPGPHRFQKRNKSRSNLGHLKGLADPKAHTDKYLNIERISDM